MSGEIIFLIFTAILFSLFMIFAFVFWGVKLCRNNDATGIILLFLAINILGIVIGWAILYNARNGMYQKPIHNENKLKNIEKLPDEQAAEMLDKSVIENTN